jgi:hypothetical protein
VTGVSFGVIITYNEYTTNAETADSYDIGGVEYKIDRVGTIDGGVIFGSVGIAYRL